MDIQLYEATRLHQCVRVCACVFACTLGCMYVCLQVRFLLLCVIWLQCFLNCNELSKSMYVFVSVCASICIWTGLRGVCGCISSCVFVCPSCEMHAFLWSDLSHCVCFHSRKRQHPSAAKTLSGRQETWILIQLPCWWALRLSRLFQFTLCLSFPSHLFFYKDCGHRLSATTWAYVMPYVMASV